MKVNYNMVVDFARPNKSNTILISENDSNSRQCVFTLLNDKEDFDMSDVATVMVRGVAASGNTILENVTADIVFDDEGNRTNKILWSMDKVVSNYVGLSTFTIEVTSLTEEVLCSFEFYVKVRNTLYNDDDVATEEDYAGFRDLLIRSQAALAAVENLAEASALKNPNPIRVELDGYTFIYDGDTEVTVDMGDLAYLEESDEVIDPVDDGILAAAKAYMQRAEDAQNAAQGYADQIEGKISEATAAADSVIDTIEGLEESLEAAQNAAQETREALDRVSADARVVVPEINLSKTGSVTTITVTDAYGTKSEEILDGAGGSGGSVDVRINGHQLAGDMDSSDLELADAIHTHSTSDIRGYVTPVSPTISAVKSDGITTLTIKDKDGTKTVTIADGTPGIQGPAGAAGTASKWYAGSGITGFDNAQPYPDSGVANALVGDMYINTDGNIYRCTKAGTATVAEWEYTGITIAGGGSSGGSGVTSYNQLTSLPSINGITIKGSVPLGENGIGASALGHHHTSSEIDDFSTATANFAEKATSLAGYGIANAYTKSETDSAISTAYSNVSTGKLLVKFGSSGTATEYFSARGMNTDKTLTIPQVELTDTYSTTGTKAVTGKAVKAALDTITTDTITIGTNKFVTEAEKLSWNAKASAESVQTAQATADQALGVWTASTLLNSVDNEILNDSITSASIVQAYFDADVTYKSVAQAAGKYTISFDSAPNCNCRLHIMNV